MNTKANAGLNFFKGFMITLFAVMVIVFAIAIMSASLISSSTSTATAAVANESNAWINVTGYTVTSGSVRGFGSLAITEIINNTNGVRIGVNNVSIIGATLYNSSRMSFHSVNISYTYAYTVDTAASTIVRNFSSSLLTLGGSVPTWITMAGLVVLITLIVVVIMVVNRMDGNGGRNGGAPGL